MSIKIISAHAIFTENAIMLSQRFQIQIEKDFAPQRGDLYIVFGGHDIAPTLYQVQKARNNDFGYIIMNSEQLDSQAWRNKYYINLCRDNPVYHYSNHTAQEIKERFKINPYSFFFFDFCLFDKSVIETIEQYDITFIGAKNPERERIMNELVSAYPNKKFYIDFEYKNINPMQLTKVLMSSKIVLNIPFYKDGVLETHRINKALSCGCKVVSKLSIDHDANEFYKDYIYFTTDLVKCLDDEAFLSQPRKQYTNLLEELLPKMTSHNFYVAKQIHTKILSKYNIDVNNKETQTDKLETTI